MERKSLYITFILMATCFQLTAQTITWDGGASTTTWSDAANWVGDVLPGVGNDVDLDGNTVVLTANTQVQRVYAGGSSNFTINSGITLTITGFTGNDDGLEINTSATCINNGTITISSIATTEEGSDGIYSKGTFTNNGTITIDGTGQHGIYLQGGTFTNTASSTISITNVGVSSIDGSANPDGDGILVDDNGGSGATLINNGSITITMTDGDDGIYLNDGSVINNENAATITISGTNSDNGIRIDDTGNFNNKSGGTFTINATVDDQLFLDNTGTFSNTGTVNLNNASDIGLYVTDQGVFTNNSGGSLNASSSTNYSIQVDANSSTAEIINNGTFTITGGSNDGIRLQEVGKFTNNSGANLNITSSGDAGIQIDDAGNPNSTFENNGQITITSSSGHGMEVFGTFNNNNGGTFTAISTGNDGIRVRVEGIGTVNNDGTLNIYNSTGNEVEVDAGANFTNTANANFMPGATYGIFDIKKDFNLGSATLTIDINGTTTAGTDFDQLTNGDNANAITISNATLHLNWGSFVPAVNDEFKVIDGSGTVTGTFASVTNSNADIVYTVDYASNTDEVKIVVTDINSTWTGTTDNDWGTATNWSTGVPTSSMDVTIPSGLTNYPTVTTAETISSLTIASGATLVATNAGFTVTNNASYTRNLATGSQWYLMSSPVNVENYDDTWVTTNSIPSSTQDTDNRGISWYNNTSSDTDSDPSGTTDSATGFWRYMEAGDDTPFAVGAGYGIIRSSTGNIEFIGSGIYTSDQTRLLQTGVNNFNLVGNPFNGFITLGTFHTTNSAVIGTTLYTWNGSSYTSRVSSVVDSDNQNFEIAPGQGFFVEASSASNVTFSISDVSHQGTDTFQKNSNVIPTIKLNLNSINDSRFAKIYYVDGTTKGYDNGYDGKLFGGVSHSFALYSGLVESDGNKYQLQSLPNSNHENMIVPIGVIAKAGNEITFSAEALNLPEGIKVFIEDRVEDTYTRLDEANATYKVTLTNAIDGVGRFYLHTSSKSVLNINDNVALDNISIYKSDASTLRIVGLQQGNTSVKIFNVLGKQVMNTTFSANGIQDISLPKVATGVYFVQLETDNGKLNKKIILE